jgi:hypothetical protein
MALEIAQRLMPPFLGSADDPFASSYLRLLLPQSFSLALLCYFRERYTMLPSLIFYSYYTSHLTVLLA